MMLKFGCYMIFGDRDIYVLKRYNFLFIINFDCKRVFCLCENCFMVDSFLDFLICLFFNFFYFKSL